MSGYTKGPWYLVGGRMIRSDLDGHKGETICVFDANKGEVIYANHKANTSLVAAAPDMLEALKAFEAWWLTRRGSVDLEKFYAMAMASMAKAEGSIEKEEV